MNFTLEGKITEKTEGKLTVSSGEKHYLSRALQRQNGDQKKGRQPWNGPRSAYWPEDIGGG